MATGESIHRVQEFYRHGQELTLRIGDLTERLQAMRVPYSATDPARADIRDAAMADNIEWIL